MEKLKLFQDLHPFSIRIGNLNSLYNPKNPASPANSTGNRGVNTKKGSYNPQNIKVPQETEVKK